MRPTMQLSTETRAVADCLAAAPVGSVIPFDAISDALGSDIRARRYIVLAAIRVLNAETGALFGSVRGVGYQRLATEDAHMIGAVTRRRIRHASRRAEKTIARAVTIANDMSPEAKRKAYAEISVLSMLAHLSADKQTAVARTDDNKPLPVAHTMRRLLVDIGAVPGDAA